MITGTVALIVLRPERLCAPANKHLLCYKTRTKTTFGTKDVYLNNQFRERPARPGALCDQDP